MIKNISTDIAPADKKIIEGLYSGFSLGYEGPISNLHLNNLQSAKTKTDVTRTLLHKELSVGHIIGPFDDPPFNNMHVNPIGLVLKKNPNEFRFIVDLSQPSGASVNDYIRQSALIATYPTIQSAIDTILQLHDQNKSPLLSKADVKSAFSLLPLAPASFPLMGLQFEGKYYIDKYLPMGASSSCHIYQTFWTP